MRMNVFYDSIPKSRFLERRSYDVTLSASILLSLSPRQFLLHKLQYNGLCVQYVSFGDILKPLQTMQALQMQLVLQRLIVVLC